MTELSISIDVPSLDGGESFYCNALGCNFVKNGSAGIRILEAGNVRIYLLEKEPGSQPFPGSATTRDYSRHWSPVHLDFGVADLQNVVSKVLECGGTMQDNDLDSRSTIAFCSDPFGNGFCLIRNG